MSVPHDESRRDRYFAIAFAVVLHVVLIGFFLKMSSAPQSSADRSARPTDFTSAHRDIPIPPEGIATDSLPLSGLRQGDADSFELSLDCSYEVPDSATEAVLRSGEPADDGVLGCPATLPLRDLQVPFALSAHYDAGGSLLAVVDQHIQAQTFAAINALQLAKPRPGRQWQGNILIRLTVERTDNRQ